MGYEELLEQNKEEMIASLGTVLRCKSEQTEPTKTEEGSVYPFGEGVQEAFAAFLDIAEKMGFETYNADNYGAMSGAFFETLVVTEILKSYRNNARRPFLYWYRDAEQREIDLLFDRDGKLHPVEIKLTANPKKSMIKNFELIENSGFGGLICSCESLYPITRSVNAIPLGLI